MRYAALALLLASGAAAAQNAGEPRALLPAGGWLAGELSPEAPVLEQDSSFVHAYAFRSDGGPFEVRLASGEFDTFLHLLSPSGRRYLNDDWEGDVAESRIVVTGDSAEAGTWRVLANAYEQGLTGAYELLTRPLDGPLARPGLLVEGAWLGGALTDASPQRPDGSPAETVPLVVTAAEAFEVRLTSAAFDTYLTLRSPSGQDFSNDDWEGSLRESRVLVPAAAAEIGTWEVVANSFGAGAEGDYAVAHRRLGPAEAAEADSLFRAEAAQRDVLRAAEILAQASALAADDPARALPMTQEGVALLQRHVGADQPLLARGGLAVALILEAAGQREAGRDTLAAVVSRAEAAGARGVALATFYQSEASFAAATEDTTAAAAAYRRALALTAPDAPGGATPEARAVRAALLFGLAGLRLDAAPAEAVGLLREALEIEEETFGETAPTVGVTLYALGNAHRAAGAYDDAVLAYDRALAIAEASGGDPNGPDRGDVANALGEAVQLGAFARARPLYAAALAAQEAALGAEAPQAVRARDNLARLRLAEADLLASAPPAARLRGGPDVAQGPSPLARRGRDRAILFATNAYDDPRFAPLSNPISDADSIAAELRRTYGFETEVVRNPTRAQILAALRDARQADVPDNSQLFVFFAGHGVLDGPRERGLGYLIPRDATQGDFDTYVSYSDIGDNLRLAPDRRVLAVFDACYGGAFFKGGGTRGGSPEASGARSVARLVGKYGDRTARLALTSGGEEPVSDGDEGEHSPFAYALIEALRTSSAAEGGDGLLTFGEIRLRVESGAIEGQAPGGGQFGRTDPGAQFFFVDQALAVE